MLVRPLTRPLISALGDPLRENALPWDEGVRGDRVVSGAAPVNTVAPVASGTVVAGQSLSVTDGSWDNVPTSYTYQWRLGGVNIGGATANTYAVVAADCTGEAIDCVVTAINASGSGTADSNDLSFSPANLTTVRGWYRADDLVTTGSAVTTWTDKSGVGNNLTDGGVSARRPTLASGFNGGSEPYVSFNGSSNWLSDTTFSWGATASPCTYAVIGTYQTYVASENWISYNFTNVLRYRSSIGGMQFGAGNPQNLTGGDSSDIPSPASLLLMGVWTGSANFLYYGTTQKNTGANTNAAPADGATLAVGATSGGAAFAEFQAAEIIIMRAAITSDERASLAAYAAARYGV